MNDKDIVQVISIEQERNHCAIATVKVLIKNKNICDLINKHKKEILKIKQKAIMAVAEELLQ